jgi:hypothetical protein
MEASDNKSSSDLQLVVHAVDALPLFFLLFVVLKVSSSSSAVRHRSRRLSIVSPSQEALVKKNAKRSKRPSDILDLLKFLAPGT